MTPGEISPPVWERCSFLLLTGNLGSCSKGVLLDCSNYQNPAFLPLANTGHCGLNSLYVTETKWHGPPSKVLSSYKERVLQKDGSCKESPNKLSHVSPSPAADRTFSRIDACQHMEGGLAHLFTVLKNIGCISEHSKTTYGISMSESVGYSPAHSMAACAHMWCSVLCGVHPSTE